jgi:hypothetical protein
MGGINALKRSGGAHQADPEPSNPHRHFVQPMLVQQNAVSIQKADETILLVQIFCGQTV